MRPIITIHTIQSISLPNCSSHTLQTLGTLTLKVLLDALPDNIGLAVYSYEPSHDDDLGFQKGDKLKILSK